MTLRFFPDGQEDTCSYGDSSNALTFTTGSIPILSHCFNFAELFGRNSTRGFVNQTGNLAYPDNAHGREAGIAWQLDNADSFDPQANYSKVLYRQHVSNAGDDRYEPGSYAYRRVNVYGGLDCTDGGLRDREILDWYGFNCWSESDGSCGTTPYSIASFTVQPGSFDDEDEQKGKCLVFAQMGAAAGHQMPKAVTFAISVTIAAMWLTS